MASRRPHPSEHTTAALPQGAPPAPLGAILRVREGKVPQTFRLRMGSCIVGAGKEAHFLVADPTVSRRHVKLSIIPEGVAVEDLSSRNGTFYLGQRIEKVVLSLGNRIRVGNVEVSIEPDVDDLYAAANDNVSSYRSLVGASPAMKQLFAVLRRLEGALVPVLIQGESGVGKELVVRAIHEGSMRREQPLQIVNCGGIARELILSELFGHKRGSFTGAVEARTGAFEAANGGTIFLDEIGELPLDVQPALLRVLESGEVRPVGDNSTKKISVRIIAATNRDLQEEVNAGRFRFDLFYRLAVVKLVVPPLRERREDIEPLASLFARSAGLSALPADVAATLINQPWPGNVRELRNAIEAFVAIGVVPGATIPAEVAQLDRALQEVATVDRPYAEQKDLVVERFARVYLAKLLASTQGNQSEAARISGIERSYLGKLLAKYGIVRS